MKAFVAVLFLASVASAHPFGQARITGGQDAKSRVVPSYVAIKTEFDNMAINCSGVLMIDQKTIITTVPCVINVVEGQASSIKVAFGQTQDFSKNKILVKDVYTLPTYLPSVLSSPDNIAAIVLREPVKKTSSVTGAAPDPVTKSDAYVGQDLFVCGFGVIDNNRNRTRNLRCTTLRVVPMAECTAILAAMAPATTAAAATAAGTTAAGAATTAAAAATTTAAPKTAPGICWKNIDDKNVCGGDLGAPLYSNSTGTLVPVGVVAYIVNSRPNAKCQDGHHGYATQLGNYLDFIAHPEIPVTTVAPTTVAATTVAGAATTAAGAATTPVG